MTRDLVFASSNPNKINEIKALISDQFRILGLQDLGIRDDIPETGSTLPENALLKAQYVSDWLRKRDRDMPVFADDSGLEVMALNGAPGVYSARYAGTAKDDKANNRKLLFDMQNTSKRQARFVTVVALLVNQKKYFFEGEVKGTIAYEPRGASGFGYDPLFIPRGYRSTFAELGPEVKNSISHRSRAIHKLITFLKIYYGIQP
ncbi:MAG TPA: RdgB/HAM1 family non-canonical purine NTP pyrophosphatase [Bacteroidia bacterium]|nr:RdgB/HAM1 family non-canonical purine NTP pyrophosphatase [Bacteroidia bacterium]